MMEETALTKVHLYREPSSKTLDLSEIARYLQEKLGETSADVRDPLVSTSEEIARRFAGSKVRDLFNADVDFEPLPVEIDFERKLLSDPSLKIPGVFYDGIKLQAVYRELLPEVGFDEAHIVFTNRLFGTFEESDRRYHAHVSIYGTPSLISTTGIVEAPAKPKEFYAARQQTLGNQAAVEKLKEGFRGRFIDYDDPRLTEILKGYVMQAIFYHVSGEPFCEDKKCRLFNARWQEEVLEAQLSRPEFCERHLKILENLSKTRNYSLSF